MPPPSTPRKIFKDFAKKEIMLSAAPPIPPRPWNSASFPNITMIMWDYAITILCFWDLSKRIISWVLTVWFISIFLLYIAMKYSSISSLPPRPPPHPFLLGDNFQSQILKRGIRKKMSAWVNSMSSCHGYLPGGLLCFLPKKTFKNRTCLWRLHFKCWSWSALAKQPINN